MPTAKSAVVLFKHITLQANIEKVRYTTNGAPHFFRQIGQEYLLLEPFACSFSLLQPGFPFDELFQKQVFAIEYGI